MIERRFLRPGETDHELLWSLVGVAAVCAAAAVLATSGPPHLPCVFHAVTGLPCPTCGSTRALLALAGGDVLGALRMNPLVVVVLAFPLYAAYGLTVSLMGLRRVRVALDPRGRQVARAAAACAVAVLWVFLIVDRR